MQVKKLNGLGRDLDKGWSFSKWDDLLKIKKPSK